jgi:hypothetical protein
MRFSCPAITFLLAAIRHLFAVFGRLCSLFVHSYLVRLPIRIHPIRTQRKHPNYLPSITNYLPSISPMPSLTNETQKRYPSDHGPYEQPNVAQPSRSHRRHGHAHHALPEVQSFQKQQNPAHARNSANSENWRGLTEPKGHPRRLTAQ